MNILILSWRSPGHPNAGGAERVTLEHAKGWVAAGHKVVWFSSEFGGGKRQEDIDGVTVIRKGDYILGVRLQAFLWYLLGRHPKFDLVVDEFHGIPFFTPLYVRGRKLGFIHEVAREVWRLNPWPKPFNLIPAVVGGFIESWVIKVLYKKVPFMTVSSSTRDDLHALGIPRANTAVVYNGVSLTLPPKNITKERNYTAIYLGAISYDKGTFDAMEAFGEINRRDEDWRFWVVGPGSKDLVQKLKKLASELNIADKVKFWGYVSEGKKFELLKRAHVMLNPSVHEGWGLVNIEANAVGTPVVGYNVQGTRDSVVNNKTGILVEKGDYRGLARVALKLVYDKSLYSRYQENCKKWASKFTWEKACKQSLELIESL